MEALANPGEREGRPEGPLRAGSLSALAALALASMLLSACGGGNNRAQVEPTLQHYLNTLDPAQRSAFPVGAGAPRVKANSCKQIGTPARLPTVLRRQARPPQHLSFWSCVVRFAHTPFHVRVALKDNAKVVWTMLMPRQVLRPGTATTYEGGPNQP